MHTYGLNFVSPMTFSQKERWYLYFHTTIAQISTDHRHRILTKEEDLLLALP